MKNNIRIAKDLIRIAKMLLAFSRNELERQLKQMNVPNLNIDENLECLEKMSPKSQKAALFWIRRGSLILPEDLSKFEQAMNLINKQRLDFQKFDSPMDVINRNDKSTKKIKSQDISFNPDTEPAFFNKKALKNGVTVYYVKNTKEGQIAVRKAIDANWGYDKNPWCLAARKSGFDQQEIDSLTEEQKERLGLYGGELDTAWTYWNRYNKYQKRIAFQNGKLLAFCANDCYEIVWWDKNDKSSDNIPGLDFIDDDMEFLMKYEQKKLSKNFHTPPEILEQLANSHDYDVKLSVAENPNTPIKVLEQLVNYDNDDIKISIAKNPKASSEMLEKLSNDKNMEIKQLVAKNPNTSAGTLEKLSSEENLKLDIACNPNTSAETLDKLVKIDDIHELDFSQFKLLSCIAEHPNISDKTLLKMINNETISSLISYSILENPNVPVSIIEKLACEGNEETKCRVAEFPKTPISILKILANDQSLRVRRSVASNPNISDEMLANFMNDENNYKKSLSKNPKTPSEMLARLADDENNEIKINVCNNPNTPVNILEKFSNDSNWRIRRAVASNTSATEEILDRLSNDREIGVRVAVSYNPKTSMWILENLAREKGTGVGSVAIERLRKVKQQS